MRYLAIDLGDARTGLALGDAQTRIVSPLSVLEVRRDERAGDALLDALVRAIDDALGPPARRRAALVVGLPLNMDGSEGPRAALTRAFAARIAERAGLPVHFHDERLSSADADWRMARSGLTHAQKKARRDALAACAILSDFLATLPGSTPGDSPASDHD
ncbi:MAG: Holliday junction resolvase RuvX [Planctomycetota bacterium]|nr:Holliday junction resolvase RuvX [Planctomycetota bacterium]